MAAPSSTSWKGFLTLSLICVPVKAFTANDTSGEVHLNQLHKGCNRRVRYQKVCPEHGELKSESIVSGFEHQKDQYVVGALQAFLLQPPGGRPFAAHRRAVPPTRHRARPWLAATRTPTAVAKLTPAAPRVWSGFLAKAAPQPEQFSKLG